MCAALQSSILSCVYKNQMSNVKCNKKNGWGEVHHLSALNFYSFVMVIKRDVCIYIVFFFW